MSIETERFVKGSKRLAALLSVSEVTICDWRKRGYLDGTTVIDNGHTIIYDLRKVFEAMTAIKEPSRPGRKKKKQ